MASSRDFTLGLIVLISVVMVKSDECMNCTHGNARYQVYSCLRNYFKDIGLQVPQELMQLLETGRNSSDCRAKRSSGPSADDNELPFTTTRVYEAFDPDQCGAFRSYTICLHKCINWCSKSRIFVCKVLGSFIRNYGPDICGSRFDEYILKEGETCQSVHAGGSPRFRFSHQCSLILMTSLSVAMAITHTQASYLWR